MNDFITQNIKSSPNNLDDETNTKSKFKINIDTFHDKIKVKKVDFE